VKCHNTISVDFIQGLLLRISKLLMHCVSFNGDLLSSHTVFLHIVKCHGQGETYLSLRVI
jgi:hypothetical protein